MENNDLNMDDFINRYCENPIQSLQSDDKLMFKFPSYVCVVGSSGCGKTTSIIKLLITNKIRWTRIYLNAIMLEEPIYEALMKHCLELEKETGNEIIFPNNDVEDIIPVDSLDENEQNVIIFDDFVNEKNQKEAMDYFQRGRKKNAMIIYISQSFHKIPQFIRLNTNYFMIFKTISRDVINIATYFSSLIDKKNFYEVFRKATKDKYNFLLIDLKTTDDNLKIRWNFSKGFKID